MPGIVGIISREPPADCRRQLAAMLQTMRHESSYQFATCEAPEMGVYAGWVAHPGSFAAMESEGGAGGAIDLVFAGEYFQDCSDTSATPVAAGGQHASSGSLLRLYDRLGENSVVELNGLFSGLLIDRRRSRALLFNDRYGVERVYVHENAHGTYFASEAKALLRVLPTTRSFDDEGVAQFLTFGCAVEGRTLFRGIRTLEGGSIWTFEGGSCRKRTYFTPKEWEGQPVMTEQAFESEFQETFGKVLRRYTRGDGRIGVSLTGGLDTRMVMACLPTVAPPIVCYTFAGLEGNTLDARIAARVAAACGLEHQILRIGQDFLSDFGSYVDRTVYITDGCAGAVGSHEIYLNAQARQLAPIRLTGNFGGEVMRGVSTFKPIGLSRNVIHADFSRTASVTTRNSESAVTFAAFREIPSNLFGTLVAAKSQLEFRTPYLDNDLVSLAYRAPSTARGSAGTALRLVRDNRPDLSKIPTDRAVVVHGAGVAYRLRRIFAEATFKLDYLHKEALPQWLMPFDSTIGALKSIGILGLHKYLPYRLWFRKDLAKFVTEISADPTTLRLPYWNRQFLRTMARDHVSGKRNYVREINAVLTLATVDRLFLGASHSRRSPGVS